MTWQNLPQLILSSTGSYAAVPVGAAGGAVTFRVPAFAAGQAGAYKIGIYSGDISDPAFIADKEVAIAPYARFVTLSFPANTPQPLVGLQLTAHSDLAIASYSVALQWQAPAASALPQGAQISLGVTIEALQAQIRASLAGDSPSYAELELLLEGLEAAISAQPAGEDFSNRGDVPILSGSPPTPPVDGTLWRELAPDSTRPLYEFPWRWNAIQGIWISDKSWIQSCLSTESSSFRTNEFFMNYPEGTDNIFIPSANIKGFINNGAANSTWTLEIRDKLSPSETQTWATLETQGRPYNQIWEVDLPINQQRSTNSLAYVLRTAPIVQAGSIQFHVRFPVHLIRNQ